jgi:NAD(P)-dependent dehydrogenase (short-subunit alcohol dehydrogenase family)
MTIKNSAVLVTGGSRGLGRALAERLAAMGARVVMVAREQGPLDTAVAKIHAAGGAAWGIAAVIVGIDFLQALGDRNDYQFAMLLAVIVTSLLGIRAFGFANELPWLPKIGLPAGITGSSAGPTRPRQPRSKRRRGRGSLSAVPAPPSSPATDRRSEMEIDALLDQVAESGLDSLSKEQRKRLEDHSKRLRKKREQ